jgi:acyl-CoA reductase-like NAD-dependent aldehyde dehydrogenase
VRTYIAGAWQDGADVIEVRSPYSGDVIDTVPATGGADLERAVDAGVAGAADMRALPAHERAEALRRGADLIERDAGLLADLITAEQGKHREDATAEASRIAGIVRLCAEEALRVYGEVLPMDAAPVGVGRLGYTRPEPIGLVGAVTPFNYPAILVIHKVGPALAAGNSVILKPASHTPLTSLFLVERLLEGGLPPLAIQCVVGPGRSVGEALVADRRVRRISFTGSYEVGQAIARAAGAKRLTCELGSNAAFVVHADASVERAARAILHSGFTNSGQNCVSTQRVIAHRSVASDLITLLAEGADRFVLGDPADPATTLAPLISEREAARVVDWLDEARGEGAQLVRGGDRAATLVEPAVVVDPPDRTRVWRDELFGPGVVVRPFESDDEALALANDTRYGLAASVATADVDRALRFAHGLRAGLVNVNPPRGSTWRADFMPWGGVGDSGFGKEGVKYAVREMLDDKLVVIHPDEAGS